MTTSHVREQLQTTLGDAHHIERLLPPGGMSRLFPATERSLDRQVVIKLLALEYASGVTRRALRIFSFKMTTRSWLFLVWRAG